jgi:bis(5'-nucleosidyl)-tetraphosphatase
MIKVESFGIVPLQKEQGVWKVLVILHSEGNHWGFPKGRADPNETPLESATRELKEETGLTVEDVLLDKPLSEQYQFMRKREFVVKTVQYFPAIVSGDLKLQQEEIRDAKWLTPQEALKQLSFREARHILREILRHLNLLTP